MRLVLLRHGLTEWNAARRIQGRTDTRLSARGRRQVEGWRLDAAWRDCAWYSSPLTRARETARLLGLGEPPADERLAEMRWGAWEGHRLEDLRRELGEALADNERRGLDFRPPGGESPREVGLRLLDWCADTAQRAPAAGVAAVTHKGVIRAAYALASGWDLRAPPPDKLRWDAAQVLVWHPPGRLAIARLNVTLAR